MYSLKIKTLSILYNTTIVKQKLCLFTTWILKIRPHLIEFNKFEEMSQFFKFRQLLSSAHASNRLISNLLNNQRCSIFNLEKSQKLSTSSVNHFNFTTRSQSTQSAESELKFQSVENSTHPSVYRCSVHNPVNFA